jgi:glucose/arabinose dehydrogenase
MGIAVVRNLLLGSLVLLLIGCSAAETPPEPTDVAVLPTDTQPAPATSTPLPQPSPTVTEAVATAEPTDGDSAESTTPLPPTATPLPPTPEPTVPAQVLVEIEGAQLPPGFSLIKFADFTLPTSLTFDDQGRLWATSRDGTVHVLQDTDGDGRANSDTVFAFGFVELVGIALHPDNGDVYLSQQGKLTIARDRNGDLVADEYEPFADLPYGRHQNNNPKFGPDGWLYLGVGSTCDVCYEVDDRSATIMRFNPDTKEGEVIATGLRNAFDIAFDPVTNALFATENGRDDLGPTEPFEELNHIVPGSDYGFPDCWNDTQGPGCAGTKGAALFFPARSSTNSLTFYTGDRFPEAYRGDLYAAVWGSYITQIERGIYQIELTPDGDTFSGTRDWLVRWPNGWLLGMTEGPDGALYVGDFTNGGIWRISYGLP